MTRPATIRSLRLVFGLGLALAATSTPAFAEDYECRTECAEARHVCARAAHAALNACRTGCVDDVSDAVRRARAICEERELEPEACERLVSQAVRRAKRSCHEDCAADFRHAYRVCGHEKRECARACAPDLDPACAGVCSEEFGICRDELGTCAADCNANREEALAACRRLHEDGAPPQVVRECARRAAGEAHMCLRDCHELQMCGADLRDCLGSCVVDDPAH